MFALALAAGASLVLAACAPEEDDTTETGTAQEPADDDGGDDEAPTATASEDEEAEPEDAQVVPATEPVAEGLDSAWGIADLPDGRLLVTEIGGTLALVDPGSGEVERLDGVPEVTVDGQGGLLDITVDEDGETVYLTYAGEGDAGSATHVARATFDAEAGALTDVETLFVAEPFVDSGQHFGSRVVIGDDGNLYVSFGDRGSKDFSESHPSQDLSTAVGTVVRLTTDGAAPDDNPFVDEDGVLDEIFSYGHRNIQGMAVQPDTGDVWVTEHGEEDGDMLHLLEAGGNFGWPLAHTGCEYGTDNPVGEDPADVDGVVEPVFFWECGSGGFPPAGAAFVTGEEFAAWEGDLLVAGLATGELARFEIDGDAVELASTYFGDEGWRLRDVTVTAEGAIYLAIDDDDAPLLRVVTEGD